MIINTSGATHEEDFICVVEVSVIDRGHGTEALEETVMVCSSECLLCSSVFEATNNESLWLSMVGYPNRPHLSPHSHRFIVEKAYAIVTGLPPINL
jgi:hypothetical protein